MTAGDHKVQRKVLWHTISIGVIVLAALLLFYKHFATRGMLMHVDMTFPTTVSRNFMLYTHTWWQYGSVQNIWNVQRIFWTYPLLAAVKVLNISTDRYLLIMFIGTFALAGISMYALAFSTIKRLRIAGTNHYAPYIGAVFAGLVFMYNPFSVSHLWPYFGYPGYAVLPLAFLLLIKAMERPRPWNVILLAVLITVAGTGPINVVWYWIMILGYVAFFLITRRFERKSLATSAKVLLPLGALYLLLNATWIMPYAGSQLVNKPFEPSYIASFSRSMLDTLSASGTVLNNARLTAGWGMPINPQPVGTIWILLSFALPVSAVAGLIVLRRKVFRSRTVLFWLMMFVISIVLATGTSSIIARPYSWFVLNAPLVSAFGWVFRAADRWLIYAAMFYGLMLGLVVAHLLRYWDAWENTFAVVVAAAVLISFMPNSLSYARYVYNPTQIPADYAQANDLMNKSTPGARPVSVPFSKDGFHYDWAAEKRIGAFDVYSSNPSLNNLQNIFSEDNLYYWLESVFSKTYLGPGDVLNRQVMLPDNLASKLFVPLSARYLVFDKSVRGYAMEDNFRADRSLRTISRMKYLDVFEFDSSAQLLRPATKAVSITNYYDELAIAQKLTPEQLQRVSFTDRRAMTERKLDLLDINRYKRYYDINSGFEESTPDRKPLKWRLSPRLDSYVPTDLKPGQVVPPAMRPRSRPPKVMMSVDPFNPNTGRQSLKVKNYSHAELSTRSVIGAEIPVAPGEIYCISSQIKYKNAVWTQVQVEGLDSSKQWIKLVRCPPIQTGDSEWRKTTCSFYMPAGISGIRPVLTAGWVLDPKRGPSISWFDNIKLSRIDDSFFADLLGGRAPPEVSFKQISPEKYEVQVRGASAPFALVFGQAYDPLWIARLEGGKTVDPVSLYSTVTGFPIDRRGDFKLTIEYVPQGWFVQGLVASLTVLVLCLFYLCFALIHWRYPPRRRSEAQPEGQDSDTI